LLVSDYQIGHLIKPGGGNMFVSLYMGLLSANPSEKSGKYPVFS
jgi:hypothetical protein